MVSGPAGAGPVVVTGAAGQVGRAVVAEAARRNLPHLALARADLDLTDPDAVRRAVDAARPRAVVNCAAYTDVDGAETDRDLAHAVNAEGVRSLARAAHGAGARLVHLSTDFVFAGRRSTPYSTAASPEPLSWYARTKAEGEEAARDAGRWTVVRTSWVFGDRERGFAALVRRAAEAPDAADRTLDVVEDERSRPTWAPVLAAALLDMVERGIGGVRHVGCRGDATRVEIARAIVEAAGSGLGVRPVTAAAWGAPAARPPYSVLALDDTEEALGRPFMHWRDAVREWMA